MRILQSYRFLVGTKIPFDKWPGIIEEFLRRQNLTHHSFHYCLEDYDYSENRQAVLDGTKCAACRIPKFECDRCRKEAADYLRKGTACQRAEKENPWLGATQTRETRYATIQSLHNFSEASNSAKDRIYAILPKIYRRYGFANTSLIYRDIDFFSCRIPAPAPDTESGYDGSGITLYRSCLGSDNAIVLVVESRYPGLVQNAAPYADALSALLPGIKRISATRILMEQDEQDQYDQLHLQAQPLIERAKDLFVQHMPEEKGNDEPETKISNASWLKKMGKRYGYTYNGYIDGIYFMEKKLPGGHYISLEFVSEPSCPSADPYVNLCGLGFHHEIWKDGFAPQNARDAQAYFTRLFDILSKAEETVFSDFCKLYPATPDWFVPTH